MEPEEVNYYRKELSKDFDGIFYGIEDCSPALFWYERGVTPETGSKFNPVDYPTFALSEEYVEDLRLALNPIIPIENIKELYFKLSIRLNRDRSVTRAIDFFGMHSSSFGKKGIVSTPLRDISIEAHTDAFGETAYVYVIRNLDGSVEETQPIVDGEIVSVIAGVVDSAE